MADFAVSSQADSLTYLVQFVYKKCVIYVILLTKNCVLVWLVLLGRKKDQGWPNDDDDEDEDVVFHCWLAWRQPGCKQREESFPPSSPPPLVDVGKDCSHCYTQLPWKTSLAFVSFSVLQFYWVYAFMWLGFDWDVGKEFLKSRPSVSWCLMYSFSLQSVWCLVGVNRCCRLKIKLELELFCTVWVTIQCYYTWASLMLGHTNLINWEQCDCEERNCWGMWVFEDLILFDFF